MSKRKDRGHPDGPPDVRHKRFKETETIRGIVKKFIEENSDEVEQYKPMHRIDEYENVETLAAEQDTLKPAQQEIDRLIEELEEGYLQYLDEQKLQGEHGAQVEMVDPIDQQHYDLAQKLREFKQRKLIFIPFDINKDISGGGLRKKSRKNKRKTRRKARGKSRTRKARGKARKKRRTRRHRR